MNRTHHIMVLSCPSMSEGGTPFCFCRLWLLCEFVTLRSSVAAACSRYSVHCHPAFCLLRAFDLFSLWRLRLTFEHTELDVSESLGETYTSHDRTVSHFLSSDEL